MIKTVFSTAVATLILCAVHTAACKAQNTGDGNSLKKLKLARKETLRSENPEKALSLLYNTENEVPELKEYVFFIRGEALEKLSNPLAADMYRIASDSEALRTKALEKQAESLEKNGLWTEAGKTYKTLLDYKDAKRKSFYLKKMAEISEKRGNTAKAAEIWESLWENYPASDFSEEAPGKITALTGKFSPSEKVRRQRAERLFSLGKCVSALAAYKTLPVTPQSNIERAVCMRRTGRKNRETLERALLLLQNSRSAEGIYVKGTLLESMAKISGDKKEKSDLFLKARRVFKSVNTSFPGSEWAGKALLKEQKIALKLGKTDRAERVYTLIKKSHPGKRADTAWNLGWFYYKNGEYEKAGRIFSENSRPVNSMLAGQFPYWRAKIFEKAGKNGESTKLFQETAERKNFSYYSFLASEKTGHKRSFSKSAKTKRNPEESPAIARARLLLDASFDSWAEKEAEIASKSHPVAACEILTATKNFHSCIKIAGNYPPPEEARFAFPQGFEKQIGASCAANGLDENLVYSLIREESRFKTDAVSPAPAFGLMQLILPTAKEVAGKTGEKEITRKKLFLPEVNIKLGCHYLASMLKRFKNNPVLALSAYNAGPSRAKRWSGEFKNLERDEFTEEIPFRETRNYVRRIFRSYGAYRAVYGSDG